MSVRPATAGDAGGIARIWNHYIRETLATFNSAERAEAEVRDILAARARDGHGAFVAGPQGEVSGFALYGQFRGGVGYARTAEHTILLDPAARGEGLGRGLMQALEGHAARAGMHTIFAGVSSGNPDGVAFHAALGYREVAVLREVGWKWGRWLDLHLMQKTLSPGTAPD